VAALSRGKFPCGGLRLARFDEHSGKRSILTGQKKEAPFQAWAGPACTCNRGPQKHLDMTREKSYASVTCALCVRLFATGGPVQKPGWEMRNESFGPEALAMGYFLTTNLHCEIIGAGSRAGADYLKPMPQSSILTCVFPSLALVGGGKRIDISCGGFVHVDKRGWCPTSWEPEAMAMCLWLLFTQHSPTPAHAYFHYHNRVCIPHPTLPAEAKPPRQ
jgi:hypothetical protein